MFTAQVTVTLPGWLTLDDRDALVEKVRETAYPHLSADGRKLTVQWTAENEWDLRGIAEETCAEIAADFDFRDLGVTLEHAQRWQGEARPFA